MAICNGIKLLKERVTINVKCKNCDGERKAIYLRFSLVCLDSFMLW